MSPSRWMSTFIDSIGSVVSVSRPTMTQKGDLEARPDALHDPQDEASIEKVQNAPGPPPDGGAIAWTQVFVGHLVIMNTW